jgi:hypothetical protein
VVGHGLPGRAWAFLCRVDYREPCPPDRMILSGRTKQRRKAAIRFPFWKRTMVTTRWRRPPQKTASRQLAPEKIDAIRAARKFRSWMREITMLACPNATLFLSRQPSEDLVREYDWSRKMKTRCMLLFNVVTFVCNVACAVAARKCDCPWRGRARLPNHTAICLLNTVTPHNPLFLPPLRLMRSNCHECWIIVCAAERRVATVAARTVRHRPCVRR